MRKNIIILLLAAFILLAAACGNSSGSASAVYNSPQSDEIYIGVAYPVELRDKDTYFYKGIELAVNTINSNGGVMGKTLKTVVRDDQNDTHNAMRIAQTFYEQGVTAVIGHWSTNTCYFVEDIYEENNVVMLTPAATGTNLFENDYQYIYRMIASNRVFAGAIADYMTAAGYERVAIYLSDDEYGSDFAGILEQELADRGISVIDRVKSITPSNIKTIMERWNAFGCDGVIMAAVPPDIIEPIRLIHEANRRIPVFGADNFDRTTFLDALGDCSHGLYMASFRMRSLDTDFWEAFRAEYGHSPDIHSIAGYEAVYMLKDAMEAAGTTDGAVIAEYLSGLKDYESILGTRSYNPNTQEFDGYNVSVRKIGAD